MVNEFSVWDHIQTFISSYMQKVHTGKPAVVTAVNGNRVDCRILTKTRKDSETEEEQADVFDIPYLILSAKKGTAKITMPVSIGDNVWIVFSDRDMGELMDTDGQSAVSNPSTITHKYYPAMALPCFFTLPNEIENDASNIVIANGSTVLTMAPDGNVTITAPTVAIEGDMTISGNLEVGGNVEADGEMTADEFTAGSVTLTGHKHAYTDDGSPMETEVGAG